MKTPALAAAALLLMAASAPAPAQVPCASLAGLALPDTTLTTAEMVPAGAFDPPGATPPIDTAACRVAGSIAPTADSDIRFELWLPANGWNGKFLSAGEGGFAGAINYGGIAGALRRGYAGGSTDTGHVGGNADFAPGHPEKVADFGWRAKHLQAARSKDLIRAFYGAPASHAYFSSCSNGGRQALMEIQRFPEDYDGVIVGAPAHRWTHHLSGFVWNEQALFNTPGAWISPAKLQAVQAATLSTCDALDGVADGVTEVTDKFDMPNLGGADKDVRLRLYIGGNGREAFTVPNDTFIAELSYVAPPDNGLLKKGTAPKVEVQ